jgi:polyisoprenoid-binding protein YceI
MRNRLTIAIAAGVAVVVLAGGGAYLYFFSGLRSSPSALGLSTTPGPTATGTPTSVASGNLFGTWTVTTGSLAGYRVKELFVGQTSKHEAVARTSNVSGSLTVSGDARAYQVNAITFTAALTDLHSVDSVAGRDVTQRDSFISRQMNLQQFPNATFMAQSAAVLITDGTGPIDVTAIGKMTIHGVTKDVTVSAKAQLIGGKIEIAGSMSIDMTDYGVSPPSVPFTTVDSQVTIEFQLFLTKSG